MRFLFFLADRLRMPVSRLLREMPVWEARLWQEYHSLVASERERAVEEAKTKRDASGTMRPRRFGGR